MGPAVKQASVHQQLKGKNFLTISDFNSEELVYLLNLADEMKTMRKAGINEQPLKGKTLGMVFEKPSTRTRISFETGIFQLGGAGIFLNANDLQLGRGESLSDTANVLSRYIDGIMIRAYTHESVEALAAHANVPVINGLTDKYHPCQVLADLQTIREVKGDWKNVKLAHIGDGNNVSHSLLIGAAMTGMSISVATPEGYEPDAEIVQNAAKIAAKTGARIELTTDPQQAVQQADVIYTDVWASMGQEKEQSAREKVFAEFQVNKSLCTFAKKDAVFMHCLPAHRGQEVTSDVIDGKQSIVFQQAENRLHAQKALMTALMG
ncbi:ornithine carbamoyltransferase [Lentibacillus cibarius]|uniref:Ornithine carbamoyltransferase n=1 Tax=Lentibacillus cibarius TaxID=2583219 RepID=A0A549YMG8_9BACI|nr:ornithine carbamoyltransferase [Lentibacillus cibarius]TMN21279.1 ornithine carbamoyltransferase [Lentibacillus cibarius]TRM13064.1 ornithine carbamoyltransferase [Lentibacillus cibarius]